MSTAVCTVCNEPLPPSLLTSTASQVVRCKGCSSLLLWANGRIVRTTRPITGPNKPVLRPDPSTAITLPPVSSAGQIVAPVSPITRPSGQHPLAQKPIEGPADAEPALTAKPAPRLTPSPSLVAPAIAPVPALRPVAATPPAAPAATATAGPIAPAAVSSEPSALSSAPTGPLSIVRPLASDHETSAEASIAAFGLAGAPSSRTSKLATIKVADEDGEGSPAASSVKAAAAGPATLDDAWGSSEEGTAPGNANGEAFSGRRTTPVVDVPLASPHASSPRLDVWDVNLPASKGGEEAVPLLGALSPWPVEESAPNVMDLPADEPVRPGKGEAIPPPGFELAQGGASDENNAARTAVHATILDDLPLWTSSGPGAPPSPAAGAGEDSPAAAPSLAPVAPPVAAAAGPSVEPRPAGHTPSGLAALSHRNGESSSPLLPAHKPVSLTPPPQSSGGDEDDDFDPLPPGAQAAERRKLYLLGGIAAALGFGCLAILFGGTKGPPLPPAPPVAVVAPPKAPPVAAGTPARPGPLPPPGARPGAPLAGAMLVRPPGSAPFVPAKVPPGAVAPAPVAGKPVPVAAAPAPVAGKGQPVAAPPPAAAPGKPAPVAAAPVAGKPAPVVAAAPVAPAADEPTNGKHHRHHGARHGAHPAGTAYHGKGVHGKRPPKPKN